MQSEIKQGKNTERERKCTMREDPKERKMGLFFVASTESDE